MSQLFGSDLERVVFVWFPQRERVLFLPIMSVRPISCLGESNIGRDTHKLLRQTGQLLSAHDLTVLALHQNPSQALFGSYRHVLERRGEALLDAALSVWEPYATSLLKVLDDMPAETEVDLPLLVRMDHCLNLSIFELG